MNEPRYPDRHSTKTVDTCYTVENDEFSEKNRYEEYPVYLPRQYTNRAREPLIFLDFLKLTEKIYYLFTTY